MSQPKTLFTLIFGMRGLDLTAADAQATQRPGSLVRRMTTPTCRGVYFTTAMRRLGRLGVATGVERGVCDAAC